MSNFQSNIFNPFPGLRPFGIEEDYLFFGREQQTSELVTLLREQRFIAVTGTSGSGKSSLVRAGLLPELQGGMMKEVGSDWEMIVLRPGGAPLRHLAEAIAEADLHDSDNPDVIGDLVATLGHSGMGLVEAIRQSHMEPDTNILVLVDQFEEIFRFRRSGAANEEQAASFVNLLLEAGAQREIPIYVIITMRSDYLGDCTEFRSLTEAVNKGEYLIPRLTRDQIRSCIEGPIQVGGGQIAFSLMQELLNSVGNDQDQLPVLQHALMRTFDRWIEDHAGDEPLGLRHYHGVGGMEEALLRHADEVYHGLEEATRDVARRVFQALTERGVDNRGIRRPTRLGQLTEIVGADLGQVKEVVEAYRSPGVTFLMPPSGVPLEPETVVDISHESLMRVWSRLEDWVDQEAQSARIYRRLAETAGLYGQQRAGLYHDPDLQIALSWRETTGPTAAWGARYAPGFQTAMSFLDESDQAGRVAEREREAARQRELEQAQALAAAAAERATLQQQAAETLTATLTQAQFVTANEKLKTGQVDEALAYLARSLRMDPAYWQAAAQIVLLLSNRSFPIERLNSMVMADLIQDYGVDNGKRLLWTLNTTYQGALWEADSGSEVAKLIEGQPVNFPKFTEDGSRLYVSLRDQGGSVVGLDSATGQIATPVMPVQNRTEQDFLLGSKVDGQIRVLLDDPQTRQLLFWDGDTGEQIALPGDAKIPVQRGAYGLSSDHRFVYASYVDKKISVWNSADGSPVVASEDHGLSVGQIAMTPDSKWVVMASQLDQALAWLPVSGQKTDQATKLRRVESGFPISHLLLHPQEPMAVLVGRTAERGYVQVIDLKTAEVVTTITQDELSEAELPSMGRVDSESHSMSGFRYLRHQRDAQVLGKWVVGIVSHQCRQFGVWDLGSGEEIQRFHFPDSPLSNVDFTSDGGRVYSTHKDGTLRIWDLFSGRLLSPPLKHPAVPSATSTEDGATLLTFNNGDYSVRVFSAYTGELLVEPRHILRGEPTGFLQLRDRCQLVAACYGAMDHMGVLTQTVGEVMRWSIRPRSARTLSFTMNGGATGQFSPDGNQVVIGAGGESLAKLLRHVRRDVLVGRQGDSLAKIWNVTSGELCHSLRHPAGVSACWYSPDGKRLATGSPDQVVRIWDSKSGQLQREIDLEEPLFANVLFGGFNQQGDRLLVSTVQGAVGVWDTATGLPLFGPRRFGGLSKFLPDGHRVVVGARDGAVRIIDSDTESVTTLPERHNGSIVSLAISSSGAHFMTGAFGDMVRVWDVATGKSVWTTQERGPYTGTTFHPDGTLIAVCNAGGHRHQGHIEVWNWQSGKRVRQPLACEGQVFDPALRFSPDGRFLAGGTAEGLVSVWDVATGMRILRLQHHASLVETLDFSPDSRRLLSTSADGTAKIITVLPVSDTLPPWLADLAEAVAGKRIGESGGVEQAGREELDAIQHRIAETSQKSGYVSWARWFFAEPQQRQASPAVRLMTRDYLAVRARGETLQEQYEAFKIDPNNGLISCRIGYLLAASKRRQHLQPHARSHWDAVALWYAEQGTDLSPDAGEAWALRATIQQIVGAPSDEAVARAVTLEAQNPIVGYVKAFQLHAQGQLVEAYQAFTGSVDSLPENRYTLDWNNDKPFLIGALRTILDEDERNPVTLAQAGQKRLVEAFDTVERRRVEAEWLTRMATQLCPDDTEIWRLRGQVLALLERHDEALLSLQKSAELDAQGEPVWPQVGQFVREHSEHLIDVKQDARADSYLLKYGVPPRSDLLTADQVDLTKYYNHTLVEEPYRAAESKSKGGSIWHRLPLGSAELNGVLFDVRGMIRLSGGAFASVDFSRPLPSAVRGIEVNRQADWLHFLHNVEAASQVPDGEEVGYYQICYADGETRRLPIRYGHDVVMWRENEFALPLGGALAWSEGRYEECKTLYHSTWENPRPAVPIAAIDFVSNNSSAAPFLLAMSLELARQQTVDPEVSSRRALHRAVYVQGQTDLTRRSVESEALHAQEADPLNMELMYRRSEVLLAIGKTEESFALVSQLRRNSPHHPSYRLLQGRIEWQQGQRLAAAETLRLPAGNVAVSQLLTQIDRLQLERFHRSVLEALGPHQARDFFVTTQVVPRDPDLPSEVVDLTSYYNAALAESWYTPTEAVGPCASLFRTLQPGPQVIQGIRFDMRGIIQLNDRKELVMKTNFPRQLTGIAVGVAGDQIHFLHAGFDNDLPNTPGATYLIHMEDGTAHEFLARWERDIGLPYMSRNGSSRATVAWRSAGVTSSSEESDAVLYVATWTNPTPNEKIRSVDFLVAGGKTQPCLVAMTVEAFDQELTRGPGEALRLSILALQKAQSRQLRLPKVAEYTANLITKAVIDAPNDATVRRYEAEVALCLGNLEDAQVAIELAIELDKASSLNWEIYGRVLARQKRFAEVQLARLKTRALQLRELIPDRDESMDKRLIDLSHHYNVALCENPFETVRQDRTRSEHLGNLPHGVAKFGGIEFDVRGVVALHGKQSQLRPLRAKLHEQVEKIAVGQTASRLHVLHGVGWGSTLPHGTVVANVVVHYRNEMTIEIPIRIGADVRDWFLSNNHRRQVTEGELVWVQPSSEVGSRDIGLYLLTWENPHPEEVIQSLDYESTLTDASAFLLGVTCTN